MVETKREESQRGFVKHQAGYHPESQETLQEYTHPGRTQHSYEEFSRAQGDDPSKRAAGAGPRRPISPRRFVGNLYVLLSNPVTTIRKIFKI